MSGNEQPLVLTLRVDANSFQRMDALRQKFFPVRRNVVPAHVSLFHQLPAHERVGIEYTLEGLSSATEELQIRVTQLRNLGRGVAYVLESEELQRVHATLSQSFQSWLTEQDRQRYRPHITIQNKVTVAEASATLRSLQRQFEPFVVAGVGFCLWSYESGPWRLVRSLRFRSRQNGR